MPVVKTKEEHIHIQKACAITDAIFKEVISELSKGKYRTEVELSRAIENKIKARGLRRAFPAIVTSGPRAGNDIHPKPSNVPLEGFAIIDFGVRVFGFCSDMTRTVYFGKPSAKEKALYEKLLRAQVLGISKVGDGASCAKADEAVRTFLGTHRQYFIHTLGHGVGKRIHEKPHIYFKAEKYFFEKKSVITIEPGIYIPNTCGIRIEDTCRVEARTAVVLTKSPKKLHIFPSRS